MIMRHEGLRLKPYIDSVGKCTIGYGRNLDDNGISASEAEFMLDSDIRTATSECLHAFPWFAELDQARQDVLVNMCFNLGISRLKKFVKFLAAMELGHYDTAANEMLDSLWAKQVKGRAIELATIIRGKQEA